MKKVLLFCLTGILLVSMAACAAQFSDFQALEYNSIDEFINGVNNAKEAYEKTGDNTYHKIEEIDWYYDFKDPVKDIELYSVDANSLSVDLYYHDKEAKECDTLLLQCLRPSDFDLNEPANEEKYLDNRRGPGVIDIMINGHKALKGGKYFDDAIRPTWNQYCWVEDGTAMFLLIPTWLLERYPDETFFDIEKVEIEERDETK